MKKQVIPALLLLMGMLSSLGVFLFAFPFGMQFSGCCTYRFCFLL